MTDTPVRPLRKALKRQEAMAYPCPECGAAAGGPCVASYDGHAIKGLHVRRQFPLGMYEDDPISAPPTEQADGN